MDDITTKLQWLKENFRYLAMIVGSCLFLMSSFAMYRKCRRGDQGYYDDDLPVNYIVVQSHPSTPSQQGQQAKSDNKASTSPPPPPRPPPPKANSDLKKKPRKTKNFNKGEKNKATRQGIAEINRKADQGAGLHTTVAMVTDDDMMSRCMSDSGVGSDSSHEELFHDVRDELAQVRPTLSLLQRMFSPRGSREQLAPKRRKTVIGVINKGIPLSCYTEMLQMHVTEINMRERTNDHPARYISEARTLAHALQAQDRAFTGSTCKGPFPVFGEFRVNRCLSASLLERCSQYYPTASTRTDLPIKAMTSQCRHG
ncbi:uncharacterized protein LOC116621146 isoform X2 [Nematostella vectensis]|nr:uncharacterized protein LOC116621146 isoform X2 [Nematostella vectensis]